MDKRVVVGVIAGLLVLPAAAHAGTRCPTTTDPADFATVAQLRKLNKQEADFGVRATGSRNQTRFIDLLEKEMKRIPGVKLSSIPYNVNRWDERATTVTVGGASVPTAGAVPYSKPDDVTAPVVYLPEDVDITAANSAGKIVLRDAGPGKVPYSVFLPGALGVSLSDPGDTLDTSGDYERDFLHSVAPDLEDAAKANARGILLGRDIPRDQTDGYYAPYEGLVWGVPGAYLGSDETQQLKNALASGAAVEAHLNVDAKRTPARTRTLLATLPGTSSKKIVVESHTDGVNAVWDNGPVTMIAMARYLADLPRACRPRTIQFAFVTGHLYQHLVSDKVRDGGAEQMAIRLDREYDRGKVAGVMVLEHLGAKEYATVPRTDGGPGGTLRRTSLPELMLVPVTESTKLRAAVTRRFKNRDVARMAVLTGADAPSTERVPPHCSFGGEGGPYNKHLLPTVAGIAAPRVLFTPGYGIEAIDFGHMRNQSLAFTDILFDMGRMSQKDIAGKLTEYRQQRDDGAKTCFDSE